MSVSVCIEFLRFVAASFAIEASLWLQNNHLCSLHSGEILLGFMQDLGKGKLDEDLIDILRHLPRAMNVRQEVAQWVQDPEHTDRIQGFAFATAIGSVMAQILGARSLGPQKELEEFAQIWSNEWGSCHGAVAFLEGLEKQYGSLSQAMQEAQEMPMYRA